METRRRGESGGGMKAMRGNVRMSFLHFSLITFATFLFSIVEVPNHFLLVEGDM